jgi:hypothetical protein
VWVGCVANTVPCILSKPFDGFQEAFALRIVEANAFYDAIQPTSVDPDTRLIQRQAFAGLYVLRVAHGERSTAAVIMYHGTWYVAQAVEQTILSLWSGHVAQRGPWA